MDSLEEKEESHENFLKSDEVFENPNLNPIPKIQQLPSRK